MKCFYKNNIYRHHIFSIVLVSVVSFTCSVAFSLIITFKKSEEKNESFSIDFTKRYYFILILPIIYLIISICFCTGIIFQKNLMHYQFIPSYKFLFYKGICGIFFCIIALIFTTNFPCDIPQFPQQDNHDLTNHTNITQSNFTQPSQERRSHFNEWRRPLETIRCRDHYEDKVYLDNFYSYFNNNSTRLPNITTAEIFILIGYFGFHFISDFSIILVNKFLSPFHVLITECFYSLINTISEFIIRVSKDQKDSFRGHFYRNDTIISNHTNQIENENRYDNFFDDDRLNSVRFVSIFFEFIGYLIYMEIIQLNFCGLNRDISRNIQKRAVIDADISKEELYEDDDDITNIMNETLEMKKVKKKE